MSVAAPSSAGSGHAAETLTALFYLSMLYVIAAILTAAMAYQYFNHEIPCPLCLLQRLALFGICFGIIRNFRSGYSDRNTGWSILFTLFLLFVSVRQTLINIYPRPGHAYVGSAVFGIHMPVWCVLIAAATLVAFGLKLTVLGGDHRFEGRKPAGALATLATAGAIYVVALCALNVASVLVQCGVDSCRTSGYRLLGGVQD
ncbi:disulfide bond formation protein B [Pseudorhodoplanes sp.]|uniref:disulfide bond formation protein B n=1 Tax=Pseudorhodoplanes sp. TaxID=1934341 RepID=UPI003D0D943B